MADQQMTEEVTMDVAATDQPELAEPGVPSSLERRVELTVALADIEKEVEQRLKHMSRSVKMPGFRPGKVPAKLVEQQYGSQARSEAIGAAVEKQLALQLQQQSFRMAGYPRIEPRTDVAEGSLGFTAIFEVYPEITLTDISATPVEKAILTVTDAEVDKTIAVLRKQRTTFVAADRPSAKDDRLVIDFLGRKDGEEFAGGKADDFSVVVGAGTMLPDFEAQLEGVTAGTAKTFDVTFPADYQVAELAGATVQFDMTVKSVEAPVLPEVDAEFAKSLGVADGDVDKMRVEVRTNLEREVKRRLQARTKEQVMEALLAANPIEVPKALVEAEANQMADAARRDMESRGMDVKNLPISSMWFVGQAERRVKLGLLLANLVKTQSLSAKPDQVRGIIGEFAETFEDPEEVIRWYYSQPQRLAEAESLALENNVVDWFLSKAAVTEKVLDFDELMGNAA